MLIALAERQRNYTKATGWDPDRVETASNRKRHRRPHPTSWTVGAHNIPTMRPHDIRSDRQPPVAPRLYCGLRLGPIRPDSACLINHIQCQRPEATVFFVAAVTPAPSRRDKAHAAVLSAVNDATRRLWRPEPAPAKAGLRPSGVSGFRIWSAA